MSDTSETCCRGIKTPFCPTCGKQLREKLGVYGLLAHCNRQGRNYKRQAERLQQRIDSPDYAASDRADSKLSKLHILADKWKNWADELTALMECARSE